MTIHLAAKPTVTAEAIAHTIYSTAPLDGALPWGALAKHQRDRWIRKAEAVLDLLEGMS